MLKLISLRAKFDRNLDRNSDSDWLAQITSTKINMPTKIQTATFVSNFKKKRFFKSNNLVLNYGINGNVENVLTNCESDMENFVSNHKNNGT